MNNTMIKYIGIILIATFASGIVAQDTTITNEGTVTDTITSVKKIDVDEVEVIKAFEVKLGEAKRIAIAPKLIPPTSVQKSYDYDITIVNAEIEYPDPIIKPLAMNADPKHTLSRFYTKLGYGMLKSRYADLSYYHNVEELYDFTIDIHHDGLDNTSNRNLQKYSKSEVNLRGSYLLGENTNLGLHLFGNIDNITLYDTTLKLDIDPFDFDRDFNKMGAFFSVSNAETTESGLDYLARVGGQLITITNPAHMVTGNNHRGISLMANGKVSKSLGENMSVFLQADGYLDQLGNEIDKSIHTIEVTPGMTLHSGIIDLSAAADIVNQTNGTDIFVDAELGVKINKSIQVYLGTDQEVIRNSMDQVFDRNPYIRIDTNLMTNTLTKRGYLGVRGKILSSISFNLSGAYEDIGNQYYYQNTTSSPLFDIEYQDVKNINIDASLEFKLNEYSYIGGTVSQNFYDLSITPELYNVPAYEFDTYAKIGLFENKLHTKVNLGLNDKISFLNDDGELTSGSTMTNLSVEVDYFITPNIAVWGRGNNLLDNNYLTYRGYPTAGLHAQGGVMVTF